MMGTAASLKAITVGGPEGVPRRAVPAGERACWSSPATSPPTRSCRMLETSVRRLEGRAGRATAPPRPTRRSSPRAQVYLVDKPGARAVADPDRLDRRAAIDARLLRAARAQHDPRRRVHLAPEQEPARSARLRLRRLVALRHALVGRAVLRRRRRADRQDRRGAEGVLQRARPASTSRCRPPSSRRRRTTWRCRCRATSRRRAARPNALAQAYRLRSAGRLLRDLRRPRARGHRGGREARRRQVHSARQVRGRDRRRPQGDRAGHPGAEPRATDSDRIRETFSNRPHGAPG